MIWKLFKKKKGHREVGSVLILDITTEEVGKKT